MVGADTSFLVDFFRGDPKAIALYSSSKAILCVSEFAVYEFLCGNLSEAEQRNFLSALDECLHVTFERAEAVKSAQIYRSFKRKGSSRSASDLAIAGSYLANNVGVILTGNPKDFEDIPGLTVRSY
jgi:predicted nucleic acid-binding protein